MKSSKWKIFLAQLLVSYYALAVVVWHFGTYIKGYLFKGMDFQVKPWVKLYFHPIESNIVNYVLLCSVMSVFSMLLYIAINSNLLNKAINYLRNNINSMNLFFQIFVLIISIGVISFPNIFSKDIGLGLSIVVLMIPVLIGILSSLLNNGKCRVILERLRALDSNGIMVNSIAILIIITLLAAVSIESINVIRGPIYLLNEYDISSETVLGTERIDNNTYVASLPKDPLDNPDTLALSSFLFSKYKRIDKITPDLILTNDPPKTYPSYYAANTKLPDDLKLAEFYVNNIVQYYHFNISRGPINHIGTILNPLSSVELGNNINNCYLQYGIGNTYIFKWIMDFFGGVSIQNYYKCYIIYIIYSILFLLMLFVILKEPTYVLAGFAIYAFAYFYQLYIPFLFAPGIIPSIHLMDTTAIMLFFAYVRKQHIRYLILAFFVAVIAVLINRQFGYALLIPLLAAVLFHNLELRQKKVWVWIIPLTALIVSALMIKITSVGMKGHAMKYFLLGLFSWQPEAINIQICLFLMVISYMVLFWLKNTTHHLKYAFVMIFAYTQCLYVYFFWSGLSNHLPTVIPFLGLNILVMIKLAYHKFKIDNVMLTNSLKLAVALLAIIVLVIDVNYAKSFYREKFWYMKTFSSHTLYKWNFERAKLYSTINNNILKTNTDLISKYSQMQNGIYILSRYDNILPYLANRYTLMPYYETSWHLMTQKDVDEAVGLIRKAKPKYLFVDTDIMADDKDDWENLFSGPSYEDERLSRFGRYNELRKIYAGVRHSYTKVSTGSLISVYMLTE